MIKTLTEQQEKRDKLKKELRSFQWTKLELEGKIYLWRDMINSLYGPKATSYSGMPHGTDTGDPTHETILKIEKIEGRINELEDKLNKHMAEFENIIESLESEEKAILTWRYINGIYWENMENYVHYSRRQCINIHDKAIDKLIKLRV